MSNVTTFLQYDMLTLQNAWFYTAMAVRLQFFSIVYTHFLKAYLVLSERDTQIKKHTHIGQHPSIVLQNES